MVQMIPNAALIRGTVTAVENYTPQEGFFVVTILVASAGEKAGINFLGSDLAGEEIKILLSGELQKKLKLKPAFIITGEIKKTNPFLWRAVEESFEVLPPVKKPLKK
jgi:hypothetical protein